VVRYRFGSDEALAIVTENADARAVEGRDGVTIYHDEKLGDIALQEVTIRLPRECYVADARTGEALGRTNTVKTAVVLGGALVLGLSESENRLTVAGPEAAARGDHPEFAIKASRPGKMVVRCHFLAPDGRLLPAYAQNVLIEGDTGTVVLPSALSDPPGDYTLRVADVITGAGATTRIHLR
jgi:hypothetical protein